jgi:hypothetical protein
MRFSTLALTAAACLLAAGTGFAEPGHPRPHEVELCHDYARATAVYAGQGSLDTGTSLASLVDAAGCNGTGSECVLQYCYGGGEQASAAISHGEGLSQK